MSDSLFRGTKGSSRELRAYSPTQPHLQSARARRLFEGEVVPALYQVLGGSRNHMRFRDVKDGPYRKTFPYEPRGTIVDRTHDIHKNLSNTLFLLIMFRPIYYMVLRKSGNPLYSFCKGLCYSSYNSSSNYCRLGGGAS